MTDSCGLLQHAKYTLPNFAEGYCTDDNARGLQFVMSLEEMGLDTLETQRATTRYAAFLDAAFDPEQRRFRNFLTFDRRWVHEDILGSDDCFGRAICASAPVSVARSGAAYNAGRWKSSIKRCRRASKSARRGPGRRPSWGSTSTSAVSAAIGS